jgi:hypothetical protein
MTERGPLFVVTFRAPPGEAGDRALRALLKAAWRTYGIRCLRIAR